MDRLTGFVVWPVLSVLLGLGSGPAWAGFVDQDHWYADGDAVVDGDGSAASPFNSLNSLDAALEAGSRVNKTVHLAGTFRGEQLILTGFTDCTFQQWDGRNPAIIRGDVVISDRWIEHVPGVRYSVPLSPGSLGVVSVVEDWDIRIDEQGRHYGHLIPASSPAQVERIEGSWHFDGTSLHIHPTDNADPNESGRVYGWCRDQDGTYLGNSVGCVFDGLTYQLWVDPAAGRGYGLKIGASTNCTIRNCSAIDFGYHGFGFIGATCVQSRLENCTTRGGRANGSTAYVFYAASEPIAGCAATDCVAHLYPLLNATGQPLESSGSTTHGFYTHCNMATTISDVEFLRCDAIGYTGSNSFAFSAGRYSAEPSDVSDPASYPVRYVDCRYLNGGSNVLHVTAKIAFVRCLFELTRLPELPPTTSAAMMTFGDFGPNRILFQSCVLSTNTGGGPAGRTLFRVAPGSTLTIQGCTVYDNGMDPVNHRSLIRVANATTTVSARQSVFVHRVPAVLVRSEQALSGTSTIQFDDCWYDNLRPDDGYIQSSPVASMAAFQSQVDPTGLFDIDPELAEPPVNLEGIPGGALAQTSLVLPGASWPGINGQPYSGHYGAYQYGDSAGCAADLDGSSIVDGLDLGILLSQWSIPVGAPACGGGPCAADLVPDGVVDGLDLGHLLASWGDCR